MGKFKGIHTKFKGNSWGKFILVDSPGRGARDAGEAAETEKVVERQVQPDRGPVWALEAVTARAGKGLTLTSADRRTLGRSGAGFGVF